jgi:hypothetical protein
MGFGIRLRALWRLRTAVAGCAVLSLLAAVFSVADVRLSPFGLSSRSLEMATASTQVVVDTPKSAMVDFRQDTYSLDSLTIRAVLLGNVMASTPVRESIARSARVPVQALQVAPPLTPKQPRALAEAGNQKQTSDILKLNDQYRLNIQANPTVPFLHIYAQAPTAPVAEALANASVEALQSYLMSQAASAHTPDDDQLRLVQLGRATGKVLNEGIEWQVAVLSFLLTFAVSCATLIFLSRLREGWRLAALSERTAGS